jgi:heme O synthase-like polyprenyltransferase
MTKNPWLNALVAWLYIALVSIILFYGPHYVRNTPDTVLAPIAMISLFTLSAAIMGYIFLSQPLQLYLDDKKKEAMKLFGNTVIIFGGLTIIVLVVAFSGVRF